jgi:hypothetical protein
MKKSRDQKQGTVQWKLQYLERTACYGEASKAGWIRNGNPDHFNRSIGLTTQPNKATCPDSTIVLFHQKAYVETFPDNERSWGLKAECISTKF